MILTKTGIGSATDINFRIFWIPTPAASNRIRSEVIFPVAGSWLDFVFTEKTLLVLCLIYISRTQTGVGFLETSWYWIRIGFGLTICKIGLEPDSKKSESEHFWYAAVHGFRPEVIMEPKCRYQAKFLTSAKFLTCYCLSLILLLRIKKWCLAITFLMCVVQIQTIWLDVRYPEQAIVRE